MLYGHSLTKGNVLLPKVTSLFFTSFAEKSSSQVNYCSLTVFLKSLQLISLKRYGDPCWAGGPNAVTCIQSFHWCFKPFRFLVSIQRVGVNGAPSRAGVLNPCSIVWETNKRTDKAIPSPTSTFNSAEHLQSIRCPLCQSLLMFRPRLHRILRTRGQDLSWGFSEVLLTSVSSSISTQDLKRQKTFPSSESLDCFVCDRKPLCVNALRRNCYSSRKPWGIASSIS